MVWGLCLLESEHCDYDTHWQGWGASGALVWGFGVNSYGTGPNFLHSTAFQPRIRMKFKFCFMRIPIVTKLCE